MKQIVHALFCVVLASSSLAHADAIVSGTVSVINPNTGTTSASDSGSSVSIQVNDPSGAFSSIVGDVGPTSGTVVATVVSEFIGSGPSNFVDASANYSLSVNGTYMLTGGTGFGLANWSVAGTTIGSGPANWTSCSITLAGATEACVFGEDNPAIGSFLVPFNTPLELSFNTTYTGFVSFNDGHRSTLTYNFDLSPVPEPGTALLVSTGLMWLAARGKRVVRQHRRRV
jgi:hypothetical protein